MTDHLIVSAAIGLIAGTLLGALREPRLKWRYQRRRICHENRRGPSGPPPLKLRRSGDVGSLRPTTPKPDITPAGQQPTRRVYHFNPATIAECGSPCEEGGPAACDCGAVTWTNQPVKPEFPLPRKIKEDWQ